MRNESREVQVSQPHPADRSDPQRRRLLLAGAAAAAAAMAPRTAPAATFSPNETLVSSTVDLIDLEYSQSRAQYARVDNDGQLWIGDIDRATGDFIQPDGKQILADTDTMNIGDLIWVYTGPEWVQTPDGDQVLYTKFLHGKRHTAINTRIGLALPAPNGQWSGGFQGPDLPRFDIFGSSTDPGLAPAIYYLDDKKLKRYRDLYGSTEEFVPGTTASSANAIRFIDGKRAIVYRLQVEGTWQAFSYDFDTKALVQLTFDKGSKSLLWMFRAPEFGNDYVLLALVNSRELRVYRNLPTGPGGSLAWTVIYSVSGPRGASIQSLEPFTYNGHSYTFMDMESIYDYPHEIWFSNIDSANPIWRCISKSTPTVRTDPEYFITDHGPIVYFNQFDPALPKQDGSFGLWKTDPGVS